MGPLGVEWRFGEVREWLNRAVSKMRLRASCKLHKSNQIRLPMRSLRRI
jgi:hypothetical protein